MADSSSLAASVTMVAFNKTHIPPATNTSFATERPMVRCNFFLSQDFHTELCANMAYSSPSCMFSPTAAPHQNKHFTRSAPFLFENNILCIIAFFFFSRDASLNDHTPLLMVTLMMVRVQRKICGKCLISCSLLRTLTH